MSHVYYQGLWRQAHLELDALLNEDLVHLYAKMKNEAIPLIFEVLAGLYLRYLQVYRKFETCLDQIVHPQKRIFLRKVVDCLMGRLQELKFEMVNIEQSDFQFLYNYAMELGYSTTELEIPIPRYLIYDNYDNLEERDNLLLKYKEKREDILVRKRGGKSAEFPAAKAAAILLQLERSRQAWLTTADMIKAEKEAMRQIDSSRRLSEGYSEEQKAAVKRIQAFWKGTKTRVLARKYRHQDLEILNVIGGDKVPDTSYEETVDEIANARRALARKNEFTYQTQLVLIKDQLKETEGPGIINHMELQIRQWFLEYRDATGSFPDYPTEDEGGSASLFVKKNPQELAMELDKLRKAREAAEAAAALEAKLAAEGKGKDKNKGKEGKKKDTGKKKDDKKKKSAKDTKKGKGKKGKKDEEEEGWKPLIPQSAFIKDMTESMIVFHDFWERRDERSNLNQDFDVDIVKVQKREEIKNELRTDVDKNMRTELEYLKLAIDGQKPKKKKKGKKKGKKGKKEKKEKDLTPNRTPESIVEELGMNGIMAAYPKRHFKDYWGSARIIGEQLRNANYDFDQPLMPQAEEIRNILRHYCVLATASAEVREKTPPIKSLLLAGPPHNGKHLLADCVCTALGACRFNLSLNFIKPIYRGKAGIVMMIHLIFKMARMFQPSVVVVENADFLVSKKAPKPFKAEYRAIKKEIQKTLKKMPLRERVFVLGVTSSPTDCPGKKILSVFNKIIPVPLPDFHARVAILHQTLAEITPYNFLSIDPHLLPTVAKITEFFSSSQLVKLAKSVVSMITPPGGFAGGDFERQFDPNSITVTTFLELAVQVKPFAGKPLEQFQAWYAKLPMNKKRRLLLEDRLGLNDAPKGKKKSNKAQKKK